MRKINPRSTNKYGSFTLLNKEGALKRKPCIKNLSIATLLQGHGSYNPEEHGGHLNPPLYLDIAPVQPDLETAAKRFAEAEEGLTYSRKGHPNAEILEKRLALLEGAEDAFVFASGMAATNCLLMEVVGRGMHLVTQRAMYGGTVGFLEKDFLDAGRTVTFVKNPLDMAEWESAMENHTAALWVEMPSNPKVCLADIAAIAKLAHSRGIPLVVDSTFTPLFFKPLDWGATFVMRSGSKYENPGGTSLLGFVMGPHKPISAIRNGRYERYGAPASPLDCWLAEVGMRTLELRMRRQSDSAKLIASWLDVQQKVDRAYYPNLPGSPYYNLAQKYMPKGCGAILAFELNSGKKAAARFMQSLKIFKHAVNLGDTRSLATYPYGTTHSKMAEKDRRDAGITESLIRLSCGLESAENLIWDLEQALQKI